MYITLLLLGILLFGIILMAIGAVLLIKAKKKVVGMLLIGAGLVFTLFSLGIFLSLIITTSVQG